MSLYNPHVSHYRMKSSYFYLFSALVLTACQSKPSESVDSLIASADEAALRAKRVELTDSRKALDAEIKRLDQAIAGLNAEASLQLVSAFSTTAQRFDHFVSFQGTVKTMQNILVYPELPGQLIEIVAREGEKVEKDQIIARLDDGGLAAQLAQAQSQRALAQTVYDRQKRLWDQEIGSEIQYLQAQTQFESSVKVVEALNVQLEKSIIRAHFDGTIDQIFKEPGTIVAPGPGAEILRIVNLENVFVEVDVPESHVGAIMKGSMAKVSLSAIGKEINSKIARVSKVINPANRSFTVEIELPNNEGLIRPNLMATVEINDYTSENAVLIPQSIVSENAQGQQYCFALVSENGGHVARRLLIKTGKTMGDLIEVVDGIEPGSLLITEGAKKVSDNQPVKWLN